MKKILFSIAVCCYIVASAGVVVNMHYCMNRYQSFSFFDSKQTTCSTCGMETHGKHGCCHDEVLAFKMHSDQQPAVVLHYNFAAPELAVAPLPDFLRQDLPGAQAFVRLQSHSPPLLSKQDTYLRINVFRI